MQLDIYLRPRLTIRHNFDSVCIFSEINTGDCSLIVIVEQSIFYSPLRNFNLRKEHLRCF